MQNDWARARLAPFAGKSVLFRCPPFPDIGFRILDSGLVEPSAADARPTLTVSLRASMLPLALLRDENALREAIIEGPADLAETLQFLFRGLSWDVEEDLSKLLGDVLARRVAAGGRAFFDWQRDAATRLGENFAEYWKEEQPLLARPDDVAAFGRDVQALHADVIRLERTLESLERLLSPRR